MTTKLITVNPKDKLLAVKELFDKHNIHHIPVVRYKEIVGLISKVDLLNFTRGFNYTAEDDFVNEARLRAFNAEEIMTKGLAKLAPNDRINVALTIFMENRFHAIPVVEDGDLVGMLTTFDILKELANEEITPDQILANQK